jgi:methylenetetrahydrofolate--tRNA-(uracil-5-)-methyltransferase
MGGLVAGINAYLLLIGLEPLTFPVHTMIGALLDYIANSDPNHFQPMNANIGLFRDIPPQIRKKHRREFIVKRAQEALEEWIKHSKIF